MVDYDASACPPSRTGEETPEMHAVVPPASDELSSPRGIASKLRGGEASERHVDLLSDRFGELRSRGRIVETVEP